MLDKESAEFLRTLYERNEITVEDANRLTGHDENTSSPVTRTLQHRHYIEYVTGEYMINDAGQWIDAGSSFRITPDGRAYIENALKQECSERDTDAETNQRKAKCKQILVKLIEIFILPIVIGVILLLVEKFCFGNSDTGIDAPKQSCEEECPVNNSHD